MSNSEEEEEILSVPSDESESTVAKPEKEEDNEIRSHKKLNESKTTKNSTMTQQSKSPDGEVIADEAKPPHHRVSQMSEENLVLKKQLKKQEERIKILATKLIRLINERSNKTKRDEIRLDEQKTRIADLEHEVSNLRDKLLVSKQQLSSYTRLIPHPPSRQASMLSSSTATTSHSTQNKKPRSARSSGSQPPRPSTATSSRGTFDKNFADRVEELLLEAKAENQALEDQLKNCRQRLTATEEELEKAKEELKGKDMEYQEEILTIKSQLDKEQDIVKKKKQLSDNIQLIRLQRESRRTASWLSTLETQCRALESSLGTATETVQHLETQLTEVQEELVQEQQKNITLQKQMEDATSSLSRLKELEAQIHALQDENKIFKESNESLLTKAFSVTEKVEKAESVEMNIRVQMSHLEAVLKTEMRSKHDLQDHLRLEREKCSRLESTNEQLQATLEKLNEEMKKYKLPVNKVRKASLNDGNSTPVPSSNASSCMNGTEKEENCQHKLSLLKLEEELKNIKHQLTTVKDEHGKTKMLLRNQVSANKEYQSQIEDLTSRLDKADEFHHKKLQDFVKVLEERTRQIAFLEKCMDEWRSKQDGDKNSFAIMSESENFKESEGRDTEADGENKSTVTAEDE
ncbi:unnamed protein product [Orchesella dallaii]|uniref:Uncharacterized protein n=1 Tax=Orchesella dallaii TaxID=48710 RepID=A0ABP1QII8_9HEXA